MPRIGCDLILRRIAERDTTRPRPVPLPLDRVVPDWRDLLDDPSIDVVVELMGGIETPRQMILEAIHRGKMVVTANKALLAEHGAEIFGLAAEKRVPVFYEAAVVGGYHPAQSGCPMPSFWKWAIFTFH